MGFSEVTTLKGVSSHQPVKVDEGFRNTKMMWLSLGHSNLASKVPSLQKSKCTMLIYHIPLDQERKFSWPHFSIKIMGIDKYHDYVITTLI
jgi:hypothetical protein